MEERRWILASASPRRKKLLQMLDIPFEVIVPDIEETIPDRSPAAVTEVLAGIRLCQRTEGFLGSLLRRRRRSRCFISCRGVPTWFTPV